MKTGILLSNLGSPDATDPKSVGRYLRQFLSDPHVMTLPAPIRWLLVNCIIVPFRKEKSAHAYQQIWTAKGSPLVLTTQELGRKVGKILGDDFVVAVGMRYGNPSIESALADLKFAGVQRIVTLPLYPQYAASSTLTAIEETFRAADQMGLGQKVKVLEPFYAHPAFVDAVARRVRKMIEDFNPEHLVFSYHGLPASAIRSSCNSYDPCLVGADQKAPACPKIDFQNQKCYRAHCFATTQAVVDRLGLDSGSYTVAFQSRFSSRWIRPFSDEVLEQLAKAKITKVAVVCPSFVADCLETLEEISMRAAQDFRKSGGRELRMVPAPNADDDWAEGLADLIRSQAN